MGKNINYINSFRARHRPWHLARGILRMTSEHHAEVDMATIRALRGRWQAMVRRKGMAPRAKSFDKKNVAKRWARELEAL